MKEVFIFGAGSIGNHLAYACRTKGWNVTMGDIDPEALERTKKDIYPQRYGDWDPAISLTTIEKKALEKEYDLVIIGTPPDSHIKIALDVLNTKPPKIILIEKPLCPPDLENCQALVKKAKDKNVVILVGYNHTLTKHTKKAGHLLSDGLIGKPQYMYAAFREHWEGIFGAHPWLTGPQDSYLGFSSRGGGAGGEHSHAINIWQHFAHVMGMGRIIEVSAMLEIYNGGICNYDRICQINVLTENGLMGHIVQDVITKPSCKELNIRGESGTLDWHVNRTANVDEVCYLKDGNDMIEECFSKTRPDDFKGEIEHVAELFSNPELKSPISLERGLETMLILAAAHLSNSEKRTVIIDYKAGLNLKALR